MKTTELSKVKAGSTFMVGGVEFIKFNENDGTTSAVTRDIAFNSTFDKNNFAESNILKRLKDEFLPKIIEEVGEDNICDVHTDLTTLDGLKPYPELVSKVSLPTFDFYRENVEVFDKCKVSDWWWLATPDTAQPHCDPSWRLCVSPHGDFNGNIYRSNNGVRPFLNFVSSIVVSCEE